MFNRFENLSLIEDAWENQPYKVVDNQYSNFKDFKSKLDCFLLTAPHFFLLFNFLESKAYGTTPGINDLFGITEVGFSIEKLLSVMHVEDIPCFIEAEKAAMEFWKTNIPIPLWTEYRHQINFRVKYGNTFKHILMQSIVVDMEESGGVMNKLVCFTDYITKRIDTGFKLEVHAIALSDQHPSFYNITNDQLEKIENRLCPQITLSAREHDVLTLISYGKTSKEISEILCLSKNTVDNHRKNMLVRNPVSTIPELVRIAVQKNMI